MALGTLGVIGLAGGGAAMGGLSEMMGREEEMQWQGPPPELLRGLRMQLQQGQADARERAFNREQKGMQGLIDRGLHNTTVMDTMGGMYQEELNRSLEGQQAQYLQALAQSYQPYVTDVREDWERFAHGAVSGLGPGMMGAAGEGLSGLIA